MGSGEQDYRDLNKIIDDVGDKFGKKVFVHSIDDSRTITYGQFNEQCNRLGRFLASLGLEANDRIVLISPNSIEWLIIFFGVMKYGAAIAPLYEGYSEDSIARLATSASSSVFPKPVDLILIAFLLFQMIMPTVMSTILCHFEGVFTTEKS